MRVLRVITPKEKFGKEIPEIASDILVDYFYRVDPETGDIKWTNVKGYVADENNKFTHWELPYTKKLLMIGILLSDPFFAQESLYFLHNDEE